VQVGEPRGDGQRHLDERPRVHGARRQEVKQRPVLVVVRDQPELGPRAVVCNNTISTIGATTCHGGIYTEACSRRGGANSEVAYARFKT
jgi:hypothetical protein